MVNHITRLILDNSAFDPELGKSIKLVNMMYANIDALCKGMVGLDGPQRQMIANLGKLQYNAESASVMVGKLDKMFQDLKRTYSGMDIHTKMSAWGKSTSSMMLEFSRQIKAIQAQIAAIPNVTTKKVYIQPVTSVSGGSSTASAAASAASAAASATSAGFMGGVFNGFGAMMKNMAAFTAVFGSFRMATNTIKEAVEAMKEFEYSNATLAAVLGKSKDEISELTDLARELGSTSLYSANEISQMQIVLARLGFKKEEINDATDSVAKLALATGDNLAKSATLTGSALRAFAYDASEANHVAAVLGVSTTKSALDMEKLRTSMSYVGAVAHQVGFDIEDTVAMLGKLVDRGIQATTAGVGIRNILLDLSKSNSKLSKTIKHYTGKENIRSLDEFLEALEQLRAAGISMEDVANMIQKRVTPSFLEMLANTKGIIELRDELRSCDDELNVMADKMQNTLSGAVKMMHNAWNGLMISFEETPGKLREVVLAMTKVINGLKDMRASDEAKKKMQQYADTIITLTAVLAAYRIALNAAAIKTAFIAGIQKATQALKTMQAVMMANPYAAAATAVAILTMAYIKQKKAVQDLNNAKSDSRQVEDQAKKKYQEETVEVNYLSKVIHDNNKSIDERRTAIDRLQSIIPNYHAEISKEKGLYNENKEALDEYLKSLKSAIKLEAYKGKITELEQKAVDMDDQLMQKNKAGMMMASKKLSSPAEVSRLQNMYGLDTGSLLTNWQELSKYDPEINALSRQYELLWKDRDDLRKRIESLYNSMLSEKVNSETIVDNEGLEDGVQGARGSGSGKNYSGKKSLLETFSDRIAKAEDSYAVSLNNAAIEVENGSMTEKEYLEKKLSATQQLYRAYVMVIAEIERELEKNPALKGELTPLLDQLKPQLAGYVNEMSELSTATGILVDAAKQAAEDARNLKSQKALYTKVLRGLERYANQAGVGYDAVGITGMQDRINAMQLGDTIDFTGIETALNGFLAKKHFQIKIDLETGSIEKLKDQLREGLDNFGKGYSAVRGMVGAIDSLKQAGVELEETLRSDADEWDKMMAIFSAGFTVIDAVVTVMEAILTLEELWQVISAKNAASKAAETTATASLTAAQGTQTGVAAGQAVANTAVAETSLLAANGLIAEANAAAAAAHAAIPFVGPALAAAAMTTISSGFAASNAAALASTTLMHFAEGGRVPGALNGGRDTVPCILAPGEVVLNAAQQNNVASKLQGQGAKGMAQYIHFEIEGTKLIGVTNNTIRAKGGKNSNLIYQH